jgi:hypothetical protein
MPSSPDEETEEEKGLRRLFDQLSGSVRPHNRSLPHHQFGGSFDNEINNHNIFVTM